MPPTRACLFRRLLLGAGVAAVLGVLGWLWLDLSSAVRTGGLPPRPSDGPPRIAALSPALAIMLRDLGLEDHIVGRHGYDLVLDKSIPVCGDQEGIEYETLLRARPTHVLLEWGARDLPERLIELSRGRYTVENFRLLTLDDVTRAASFLTDRYGSAPGLRPGLADRLAGAWAAHPGRYAKAGRILLLETIDPPAALGPGSFHWEILERLGGTPAITRGKPFMTLDAEEVLRLAPDGVILLSPRDAGAPARPAPAPDELKRQFGRLASLDIPAMRNGRLALIDDPLGLIPSSSLLGVTERIGAILRDWDQQRP